jgi:hypothetical protein
MTRLNGHPLMREDAINALDRVMAGADMVDTLAGLLGQADDIDVCGRDGLGALLGLIAEHIAKAANQLAEERHAAQAQKA